MEDWAIVAIMGMLVPICAMYYKHRGQKNGTDAWTELSADFDADELTSSNKRLKSENEALKSRVDRLEERVRVLERIATDKGSRLNEEFENLEQAS